MGTLLLHLAAPLQSWGFDSKFETRRTGREPTKSGVIGLLAAALGQRRNESPDNLSSLRFGVRVDREGKLLRDFHMVRSEKTSYVTTRYYLADAVFLAGLESDDDELLKQLDHALRFPVFPLFLGRRSCPPTPPLSLGIRPQPLLKALQSEEYQAESVGGKHSDMPGSLRIVYDVSCNASTHAPRCKDFPVSFDPRHRVHSYRACKEEIFAQQEEDAPQKAQDSSAPQL